MTSTSEKRNVDFKIGKQNILKPYRALAKQEHTSAIADHIKATGHNIKWDHFEFILSGKTDYHCKIKEILFMLELNPTFNTDLTSESCHFINVTG